MTVFDDLQPDVVGGPDLDVQRSEAGHPRSGRAGGAAPVAGSAAVPA